VPPRVAVCCWDGGWHDRRSTPRTLRRQHFGRQSSARCKAVELPFAPVCAEAQGSSRRVSLRAGLWEAASMHSSCGSENRLYRLSQLIRLAGLNVANIGRRYWDGILAVANTPSRGSHIACMANGKYSQLGLCPKKLRPQAVPWESRCYSSTLIETITGQGNRLLGGKRLLTLEPPIVTAHGRRTH
jgi:hypothetical protein